MNCPPRSTSVVPEEKTIEGGVAVQVSVMDGCG